MPGTLFTNWAICQVINYFFAEPLLKAFNTAINETPTSANTAPHIDTIPKPPRIKNKPFTPIANAMKNVMLSSIKADVLNGNNSDSGGIAVSTGTNMFYYGRMSITHQYAESIDHFFDMFGYAVNTVDVPNINSRPEWNYVKTIGCSCWGDCPADDLTKIKEIFNNGVRFWKNPDHMGNYDYANK